MDVKISVSLRIAAASMTSDLSACDNWNASPSGVGMVCFPGQVKFIEEPKKCPLFQSKQTSVGDIIQGSVIKSL